MLSFMHSVRWRYLHLRFALSCHLSPHSITHFPQTISRRIFRWATHGADDMSNYKFNAVVNSISASCRHWRELFSQQLPLWSCLTTHPHARSFVVRQQEVLRAFPTSPDPINVDIVLHNRYKEQGLVAAVPITHGKRETIEQMQGSIKDVVSFLTTGPKLYFSRCVRFRILGTRAEWAILSENLGDLRRHTAHGLEELVVDVFDASDAIDIPLSGKWLPCAGSTNLRVLRVKGVADLFPWPVSSSGAPSLSHLVALELNTVKSWLGLEHLLAILRSASLLDTMRLQYLSIPSREEEVVPTPIRLPAMKEMGFARVSLSDLQALFKAIAVPNLDRLQLTDCAFKQNTRTDLPGKTFIALVALIDCPRLVDLRVGRVAFEAPLDIKKVLARYPALLHFQIYDSMPRVVQAVHQCLVDTSVVSRLAYFRYAYPQDPPPEQLAVVREDDIKEVKKKRPSLILRHLSVAQSEHLQFGHPWPNYDVEK